MVFFPSSIQALRSIYGNAFLVIDPRQLLVASFNFLTLNGIDKVIPQGFNLDLL